MKTEILIIVFELGDQVPAQERRRIWQLQPCGSGFRVKNTRKGLWDLLLWLRKATEVRCVSGLFLHEGSEKPLSETVKMKLGLCWKHKDVDDSRGAGYGPRKAVDCVLNQPRGEKPNRAKRSQRSEVRSDITHGDSGLGVRSAGFQLCLIYFFFTYFSPF